MRIVSKRIRNQGLAAVEFLILLSLVALAAIFVLSQFGQKGRGVFARSVAALEGERSLYPVEGPSTVATSPGGDGEEPGTGGVETPEGAPSGDSVPEDKWRKFREKLQDGVVKAAVKNYGANVNQILKEAADGLDLSAAQYQEMVRRAAREFALHGEAGAIHSMEALQDVSSTLQRGQNAAKAVATFEVLENGMKVLKVVGAGADIINLASAVEKSMSDPAHQHEHEGEAVGIAAGAVGGGALIAFTAPISVPVLIVGVVGAAVIGIVAKPAFGWLGRQADNAKAARKVIRVR